MVLLVAKITACPRYGPFKGFRPHKPGGLKKNSGGVKKSKNSKFLKTEGDSEEMSTNIK